MRRQSDTKTLKKVVRIIDGVRSDNLLLGQKFDNLDDLNKKVTKWCSAEAKDRTNPQNRAITISQAYEQELPRLLTVNHVAFPVFDRKPVRAGKTPYVRFDLNDYSVPARCAHRDLLVEASLDTVSISNGLEVVAKHARSFDKGKQIEDEQHVADLVDAKRKARKHRAMDRLRTVAPTTEQFFLKAAERGHNLGRLTQLLVEWLNLYGAAELEAALTEVLTNGTYHSAAILNVLQRRRSSKGLPPPVPLHFAQVQVNQISVKPRSLQTYDKLISKEIDQ